VRFLSVTKVVLRSQCQKRGQIASVHKQAMILKEFEIQEGEPFYISFLTNSSELLILG
jgi:hypothetical protein